MIGVKNVLYPVLCALCWGAFLSKVRGLRLRQRDPALLALVVAFAVKGAAFLLATPRVARAVDRRVGVDDLAALGIHLLGGVAFGAAVLVVLVYWAHNPDEAWRRARWRLGVAALVMATMFSLWLAAGTATQPRSNHYLVQNAHRPLVAIYLLLYVTTLLVALGEIARLCLKYAGPAGRPWLRRGLRVTAVGALVHSVNFLSRAFSIVAIQLGMDPLEWEWLILVGTGVGVPLMVAGLTMPSWGPHLSHLRRWWGNYRTYWRLYPLWRDLCRASPPIAMQPRARSVTDLNYRLYRRVIEIRDGFLALRSYQSPEVRRQALRSGRAVGLTGDELEAVAAAAQLRAALRAKANGCAVPDRDTGGAHEREAFELLRGDDLATEATWLAQIARAYTHSPVG